MKSYTLEVSKNVQWIGVLDKGLVTFDVIMETLYGSTYNSYLVEKQVIVETVKESFYPIFLENIKKHTKLENIKYVVVNHTEPDHSGSLKNLIEDIPEIIVVGSMSAIRYLKDLLGFEFKHLVVKDGDTLNIGEGELKFISAPNLHWPDSMYTWYEKDGILFTCDSFGSHFCNELMFDDLVGNFDDAFKYYFDVILKPFSKFMLKAIEKIENLPIKSICTGHGPVLRSNWKKYVELSKKYSNEALTTLNTKKVLVTYVSAYHNTQILANWISEGIKRADSEIEVSIIDLEHIKNSELTKEIETSNAYLIGSPTINQNTLPQIYNFFSLINPIVDRGKLAGSFGSYGWSGESAQIIKSNLQNLKLEFFGEGIFIKFSPHQEEYKKCIEYGFNFANRLLNK